MAKLTPKQQRFVSEYLVDADATKAATRAGYSPKTAAQMGYKLVHKSSVRVAIQDAQSQQEHRTQVTADWVIDRLKAEAELTGDGGKHAARVRALELLGKHLGMFAEQVKHTGQVNVEVAHDLTHQINADPEAARLGCQLLERVTTGLAKSRRPGVAGDRG